MPAGDVVIRGQRHNPGMARVETGVLVKIVPSCGPVGNDEVFTTSQLQRLDAIISDAENATGLRFAAYIGYLGEDSRARAEEIVASFGDDAAYTALVALSPGQRVVEIVTGTEAALRIPERGARAAVLSVIAACGDGDLYGGLTNGIRILTDHAGVVTRGA
ncbi:MAG: DUF5130 family protein [Nakamurella sp.]